MALQVGSNVIFPQWFAGIAVTLLVIQIGILSGWSSPTLAELTDPTSTIPSLTTGQASWIASIVNLGRFVGAILGPICANYIGSKQSIFVTVFPLAIGWLLVAVAYTVEWLYISRLLSGLGLGFGVFPLDVGEVSMPEIRGALISLATVDAPVGQVLASVCGSYLSMATAAYIYIALAVVLMALFFWLPESPHHLVKIGNSKAARSSIDWYRAGRDVGQELEAVEKFITSDGSKNFASELREFRRSAIRRATFKIMAFYTFMQICGLNSILFYMKTILIRANFTLITRSDVVIYVNICGIFAAMISTVLIGKCGRRFLLLLSSTRTYIGMVSLVISFFLQDSNANVMNLQWLPVTAMLLYVISFYFGLMPVPNTVLSERFPANIKCIAAGIASLTAAIMAFLSSKSYQPLVDLMSEPYIFLIYAICSILVVPYTLFFMPETNGKSLQQIQDELMKK